MTILSTPPHVTSGESGGFRAALRAEWTKFRTVRGWLVGLGIALLLLVALTYVPANGVHNQVCTGSSLATTTCQNSTVPDVPTGPDGEAVADSYYSYGTTLTGDGTLTAEITALTGATSTFTANAADTSGSAPANALTALPNTRPGLAPWAKAGLIVTAGTTQGSRYAAVLATGGHGVRFQYDYTHDTAGQSGAVTAETPRWLRLSRSGDTVTAFDSTTGTDWTRIGVTTLADLPSTVHIGLFATSPETFPTAAGNRTFATATFTDITLPGATPARDWQGQSIGEGVNELYPVLTAGGYQQTRSSIVVGGSGDIAPAVVLGQQGQGATGPLSLGIDVGLIVLIVIAALFVTSEYRRGLIRTTFTAMPLRGRVLAARAVVIGAVGFGLGVVGTAVALPLGVGLLHASGGYVFPISGLTQARILVGVGAVAALFAVIVLAVGVILRSGAATIAVGVVLLLLPSLFGPAFSGAAAEWLLRTTPAAGLAVLSALPYSAQVDFPYTYANGYYPLPPLAGLTVLAGYAAVALALAVRALYRRDA